MLEKFKKHFEKKEFLKNLGFGSLLGIGSITPGVSGGVMAVALGVYERIISAVCNLLKSFYGNFMYLLPFGIGAVFGIFAFSFVIDGLINTFPMVIEAVFIGFVAGSMPSVVSEANEKGFKLRYLISFAVILGIFIATIAFGWLDAGAGEQPLNFFNAVLSGIILVVGAIVPGLSSSMILISIGTYHPLLEAITKLEILKLLPVALGAVIIVFPTLYTIRFLLKRFHGHTYYGVIGVVLGTILLFLSDNLTRDNLVITAVCFVVGLVISLGVMRLFKRKKA